MKISVDYTKRVYGLDVMRAVAIILVVMVHGNFMIDKALPGFPWIPLFDGVELFFTLSGFLIGGILIRLFNKGLRSGGKSIWNFWVRRWFRTLPNYYLFLSLNVLFMALGWIGGDPSVGIYNYFLFLQNLTSGFTGFFWESWSLSVEEWFYLIFPLLFAVYLFITDGKKALLLSTLTLVSVPLILRFMQMDEQVDPFWWQVNFRKVVLLRLDSIGYGVLFAFIKFYFPALWSNKRFQNISFLLSIGFIVFISYLYLDHNQWFFKTLYFSVVPLGISLLLPLTDNVKDFKNGIIGRSLTHISLISYSMYLLHLGLVVQVISKNFMPETGLEGLMIYAVYWVVVVVVSTIVYKYFEKPILNYRDKIFPD